MIKNKALLLCILLLGLIVRLFGNNWDQGWHLHPDERFLTMVGTAVKIPSHLAMYLDQYKSSFNPGNNGHSFFVYGTFPLLLNKLLAQFLGNDTYDLFHLQGRLLSGLADFLVILIVYKLVELVEKKLKLHASVKYLGAFLYSVAVLPIQLSHFYTVDTFLNLFCWASLYYAVKGAICTCNMQHVARNILKSYMLHVICYMCISGLFLGLALASKVSAIYFAPLVGIFIVFSIVSSRAVTRDPVKLTLDWIPIFPSTLLRTGIGMTLFLLFAYLALRLGSPYYFETGTIFDFHLSTVFLNSIKILRSYENPALLFPPGIQWISKSSLFPLQNIVFFGVGPVYFLLSIYGAYLSLQKKNKFIFVTIAWAVIFLVFQSMQFAKTMRYLIFLYPLLAIFAAIGIQSIAYKVRHFAFPIRSFIYFIICVGICTWPLAFMSIYTTPHSRVTASYWMYQEFPSNSTILTEYWDDPLPLMVQNPGTRNYKGNEIHIFDPDSKSKWETISSQLASADYYVMSSNRGWGSIGSVPEVYPTASVFYKNMMENKSGYQKIKTFSSYPSLRYLGIPLDFPDQWAEEAFTVYDHPEVMIFKKK